MSYVCLWVVTNGKKRRLGKHALQFNLLFESVWIGRSYSCWCFVCYLLSYNVQGCQSNIKSIHTFFPNYLISNFIQYATLLYTFCTRYSVARFFTNPTGNNGIHFSVNFPLTFVSAQFFQNLKLILLFLFEFWKRTTVKKIFHHEKLTIHKKKGW